MLKKIVYFNGTIHVNSETQGIKICQDKDKTGV